MFLPNEQPVAGTAVNVVRLNSRLLHGDRHPRRQGEAEAAGGGRRPSAEHREASRTFQCG